MTGRRTMMLESLQARMVCERCGHCCTLTKNIKLTTQDIAMMAMYYGLDPTIARIRFTKLIDLRSGTRGIRRTMPCMFYNAVTKSCKIYPIRPKVCRDFPFRSQIDGGKNIENYEECKACKKLLGDE